MTKSEAHEFRNELSAMSALKPGNNPGRLARLLEINELFQRDPDCTTRLRTTAEEVIIGVHIWLSRNDWDDRYLKSQLEHRNSQALMRLTNEIETELEKA